MRLFIPVKLNSPLVLTRFVSKTDNHMSVYLDLSDRNIVESLEEAKHSPLIQKDKTTAPIGAYMFTTRNLNVTVHSRRAVTSDVMLLCNFLFPDHITSFFRGRST